jgi:hypothetical protein
MQSGMATGMLTQGARRPGDARPQVHGVRPSSTLGMDAPRSAGRSLGAPTVEAGEEC